MQVLFQTLAHYLDISEATTLKKIKKLLFQLYLPINIIIKSINCGFYILCNHSYAFSVPQWASMNSPSIKWR